MAKVVYFGKHISDKIRDANRVFSEILMFMVMLFLINL